MGSSQAVNGMNGVNGCHNREHAHAFTIKDTFVENLRPFRVIVVGAGFSGILAAIRIPERLRNVELVVYEKNEGIGGVWYDLLFLGSFCYYSWDHSAIILGIILQANKADIHLGG
jgi:thioredoxin reductase